MDLWKLGFTGQSKSKARGSGSSHGSQDAITKHPTTEAPPRFPRWLSGKGSACNTGDTKMWVQSLDQEDDLEEEMASHVDW